MSRGKAINLICCSVPTLVGCAEPGHECEAADMMMYRIIAVAALVLSLLLAYFLWRSYKYNNVLAGKCERLQAAVGEAKRIAIVGEASKLCDDSATQRLEASSATQSPEASPTTTEPTAHEQLFHRLCLLMDGSDQIYTDQELDRARLAKLLATNEHYVSDAVSACTNGGSIIDFINGYRLRHAVLLLTTTKDPIGLIAEISGFSRRSFYRVFDEAYHISPSEYRKAVVGHASQRDM